MSQLDEKKKKGKKKGSVCLNVTCITRISMGLFMAFDLQLEFPELNVAGFYLESYVTGLNVVFSYSCKYLMWFLF